MSLLFRSQARSTLLRRGVRSCHVAPLVKAVLPDLPYGYGDLEPVLPARLMELHHNMHHAAYVANYNKALETFQTHAANDQVASMVGVTKGMNFNAGGHVNHCIFWTNLAPTAKGGGAPPEGALAQAINEKYGSLDAFTAKFNADAALVQGSGWGWLVHSKEKGIHITTTANQDIVSTQGVTPLLGVDVWEHAYYLGYENRRPEYLKNIWKVVNWKNVAERYQNALSA